MMTSRPLLRFPALWAPDAPALRPLERSWAQDVLLVKRAHRWATSRIAIPPVAETYVINHDEPPKWEELLRVSYTRWSSDGATGFVAGLLTSGMSEADSLAAFARELWPAWWASGVLPGDLPPLDRASLGRVAQLVDRYRDSATSDSAAPGGSFHALTRPVDLLCVQAPLAILARCLGVGSDDPVARIWLGAWGPERAQGAVRGRGAVELSRARYVLATTGWPAATREEAALHLWDLWSRARYPMGADEDDEQEEVSVAETDPWLVALAKDAPTAARSAMLEFLGRDAPTVPRCGWLTPRLSVELASLLQVAEGEQLARRWVRSPIQAWREAGLRLLTQVRQAEGTEARSVETQNPHGAIAEGLSSGTSRGV